MHELSIARALVDEVEKIAVAERAQRVVSLTVQVGALSGVDPHALEWAFPVAAEGTVAGQARLEIESVPARAECNACGAEYEPGFPFFACERCGSENVRLSGGRELLIHSVEMDIPDR